MSCPAAKMAHIPEGSIDSLPERIEYLKSFIGFTSADAAALHAAAGVVGPLVPTIVDVVYKKLLSFDITAKAFVPRQTGYTGEAPAKVSDLSLEHPQIKFRKDFLAGYLVKLVTMDYEKPESWVYLDKIGLMHTGVAGFAHRAKKPALRVEYMHCAILLGYVEDILVDTVITHPDLDIATKNAVARAANKLIWIQNDLFARHYMASPGAERKLSIDRATAFAAATGLIATGAILAHWLAPLFFGAAH